MIILQIFFGPKVLALTRAFILFFDPKVFSAARALLYSTFFWCSQGMRVLKYMRVYISLDSFDLLQVLNKAQSRLESFPPFTITALPTFLNIAVSCKLRAAEKTHSSTFQVSYLQPYDFFSIDDYSDILSARLNIIRALWSLAQDLNPFQVPWLEYPTLQSIPRLPMTPPFTLIYQDS